MKKFTVLIVMLLLCVGSLFAQVPEKFNYQAVVRNASNALVTNAQVGVRVSILQGSAAGNAVYVENHTATTNANGLLTIEIGGGTVQEGYFTDIKWWLGMLFLKTEIDPTGGSNYTIISTQQLLSVPYALYAETAGNGFSGDYNDLTNKPTIPQNLGDLTNDAGYVTLDSIPAQVNADWNATEGAAEILNKPTLFSGDYNDLTNKPANADFGQGLVRAKVNNPSGATDINVTFTGYSLVTGGVVSLLFQRNVPAAATLNINNQGAKPIYYHESALTDGVIKANDRCLFMYNSTMERYYLLAIDRWGVDLEALATVAHTGSYNDLTDKPTIPTVPTNISAFVNDAGYITAIPDSMGGISLESDPIFSAWDKDYDDLINKPDLAPVATSGNYDDLTNKPTIPTVPTNISAFVNDAGYLTAIPDSLGGISLETDPVFSAWNKDYNDLTNKPDLAPVATSGSYNDLTDKPTIPAVPTNVSAFDNDMGYITSEDIPAQVNADWDATSGPAQILNKPVNADFGQGIVRTIVNNTAGATDIAVPFTGYAAVTGGVVSLSFKRAVPAEATLNINNQGAKPILYKGTALTAGVIKAGDRCLFMYNSTTDSYYLLANDRWGADIDGLAAVAYSGSYNDLTDKPTLFSGNYNDLTDKPTLPTNVSDLNNDAGFITQEQIPVQVNADWNATNGPAQILNKPTIPTVPTNISAFFNDMGYITAIPDSLGGISIESDPIFSAWNKDYNDLTNKPELFSGNYDDLTNKPVNADFGQGIVRTTVNNTAGATDIAVPFTGYAAVTGGVVSLSFKRAVPAEATLNINNQGAKPILYKGTALTAGVIKAGDRCLFMYNSTTDSYYLLSNDRWGADIDGLATVAHTGSYNDLTDKPNLAPVATSGNYNDLTNTPTIPTVPTSLSDFDNDMGFINIDDVPAQVNADWDATSGPAQILNKPVNADFGQGIVRTIVNNTAGATDIAVPFTGYAAVTGGVVSLSFKRAVPAEATLNINNQGAKPILYKGTALTAGVIKAGDRCLFMYNSTTDSYYLLANDRWGADIDGLAAVAHTGSYNDLTDKPNFAPVATSGNYNDLTNTPTIPTVNNATLTIKQNGTSLGTFTANQSTNKTINITTLTADDVQAMINDALSEMQQQMDSLKDELSSVQDALSVMPQTYYMVPSTGSKSIILDNAVTHVDVYDWGGPNGGYANNWDGSLTLVIRDANKVFKITGSYDLESDWDYFYLYNGSGVVGANTIVKLSGEGSISEPIYSTGDTITIRVTSDFSNNVSGISLSIDIVNKPSCTSAKAIDVQSNYYNTVQIGNQCWMKENLRVTRYADWNNIPLAGSNISDTDPYYYNPSTSSLSIEQRGYFYNWPAVMHGESPSTANPSGVQGICPSGWHVPSDAEWIQLMNYVGSYYACGGNTSNIAKALASTEGNWPSSTVNCAVGNIPSENNDTGFGAVPTGYTIFGNELMEAGEGASFWTTSVPDYCNTCAISRYLKYDAANVGQGGGSKSLGHSVRCVRNE